MSIFGDLEGFTFVEQIRATLIDALSRFPHTRLSLAEEAGISTSVLLTVLRGGDAHPNAMRKLDAWCHRWGALGTWPEQVALAALAAGLPVAARLDARAACAEWWAERYKAAGRAVPDWIVDELDDYGYLTRRRQPHTSDTSADDA